MFTGAHYVTGSPPKDRNCFECGRIGHIAVNCPRRIKQREMRKAQECERKKNLDNKKEIKSGVVLKEKDKDVNDNFDYNSLKQMEVDPNQGAIDYLKTRSVFSEEPEFVTLADLLPGHDAVDRGSKGAANHEMMEPSVTRRCRERRRQK